MPDPCPGVEKILIEIMNFHYIWLIELRPITNKPCPVGHEIYNLENLSSVIVTIYIVCPIPSSQATYGNGFRIHFGRGLRRWSDPCPGGEKKKYINFALLIPQIFLFLVCVWGGGGHEFNNFLSSYPTYVTYIGPVVLEEKMLTHDPRHTTHHDGRQDLAKGHLIDSRNLKTK